MRYFVVLAEHLHFGQAAIQLRITQPSLSQQIRQLEDELQTLLLQRTHRRVQLTEAGRLFLEEARDILVRADKAKLIARRASGGDAERLHVGFTYWMDAENLSTVIRKLSRLEPRVRLVLRAMSVPSQIAALQEGRLDAGLVRPPITERAIVTEPLTAEAFAVALPGRHHLASMRSIPLTALADERFIQFPRDSVPQYYDLMLHACREAGFVPHVRHEVDHPALALRLVAAGLGISLVPDSARKTPRPGVVYRPLRPSSRVLEIALAWRRDNGSPALKTFVQLAKQVFA